MRAESWTTRGASGSGDERGQLAKVAGLRYVDVLGIIRVVKRVKVRMVEDVECIGSKLQPDSLLSSRVKFLARPASMLKNWGTPQVVAAANLQADRPGEGADRSGGIGIQKDLAAGCLVQMMLERGCVAVEDGRRVIGIAGHKSARYRAVRLAAVVGRNAAYVPAAINSSRLRGMWLANERPRPKGSE